MVLDMTLARTRVKAMGPVSWSLLFLRRFFKVFLDAAGPLDASNVHGGCSCGLSPTANPPLCKCRTGCLVPCSMSSPAQRWTCSKNSDLPSAKTEWVSSRPEAMQQAGWYPSPEILQAHLLGAKSSGPGRWLEAVRETGDARTGVAGQSRRRAGIKAWPP